MPTRKDRRLKPLRFLKPGQTYFAYDDANHSLVEFQICSMDGLGNMVVTNGMGAEIILPARVVFSRQVYLEPVGIQTTMYAAMQPVKQTELF